MIREKVWENLKAAWSAISSLAGTFGEHRLTDWAAALTYYGLLALFPGLIVIVSLVGLFGDPESTTRTLTKMISELGPSNATSTYEGPIQSLTQHRGTAGAFLLFGTVASLLSASSYIGAFSRASQEIYGVKIDRPFYETRPQQLLWTAGMVLIAAVIALTLVLTGPLLNVVADPLGIGGTAVEVWKYAKWPALLVLVVVLFSFIYYVTAPVRGAKAKWLSAGGLLAVGVWILASAGLALYVSNFGSYDKTYGALAGVIVLLVWIYVTNIALLLGVELNASQQKDLTPVKGGSRRPAFGSKQSK